MIVESVNFKTIKIIFDNSKNHLYYGDLLKIIDDSGYGVLAQVFQINYSSNNSAQNIASAKILFTIKNSTSWLNWRGNIPAKHSYIEKIQQNELLSKLNAQADDTSVNLGVLASYNTDFKINPSSLKNPTLIFSDDFFQKIEFTNLLTDELVKTNNKIVILDFNGGFNFNNSAEKVIAGKDFKLPLNTKGIQSLYETLASDISDETRAIIEDIFIHIEDFTSSGKNLHVSFKNFKDVIETEYRQNRIVELALLKNKLIKLEKEGIFANKRSETTSFIRNFNDNDIIIIDLSQISILWHKYFVEYIIDYNIFNKQNDFFLILNTNSYNLDSKVINKLFIQGLSSGIKPITITHFESELNKQLLSFAKNMLLFAPKTNSKEFIEFSNFLSKLGNNEILVYGQVSKYIPLFVQVGCNSLFEESEIQQDITDIKQKTSTLQEPVEEEYAEQSFNIEQSQELEAESLNTISQAEEDYYKTQANKNDQQQKLEAEMDYYNTQTQKIEEDKNFDSENIEQSKLNDDYKNSQLHRYNQNFKIENIEQATQAQPDCSSTVQPQLNNDYKDSPQHRYNQNFKIENPGQPAQSNFNNIAPQQLSNDDNNPQHRYNKNFDIENIGPAHNAQSKLDTNYKDSPHQRYNQCFDIDIENIGQVPKFDIDYSNTEQTSMDDDYQDNTQQEYNQDVDIENIDQIPQFNTDYSNTGQASMDDDYQDNTQQEYNQDVDIENIDQVPQEDYNDQPNINRRETYQKTLQKDPVQNYDPQVSEDELDFYTYNQPQENQDYLETTHQELAEGGEYGEILEDELDFYNYDQPQENEAYHEPPLQEEVHCYENENYQQELYNEEEISNPEYPEDNNENNISIEELNFDDGDSDDFSLDFYEQAQEQLNEEDHIEEDYDEKDNDDEDIGEEDQDYDEDIESLYTAKRPEAQEEYEEEPKEEAGPVVVEIGEKDFSGVNHNIPIYSPDEDDTSSDDEHAIFEKGDKVKHSQYGVGVVEKVFKHDGKKFYKFNFKTVGIKVLDPSYSPMEKL